MWECVGRFPVSIWILFMKRMKVLVCVNSGGGRIGARSLAHPPVILRRICNQFYWSYSG